MGWGSIRCCLISPARCHPIPTQVSSPHRTSPPERESGNGGASQSSSQPSGADPRFAGCRGGDSAAAADDHRRAPPPRAAASPSHQGGWCRVTEAMSNEDGGTPLDGEGDHRWWVKWGHALARRCRTARVTQPLACAFFASHFLSPPAPYPRFRVRRFDPPPASLSSTHPTSPGSSR